MMNCASLQNEFTNFCESIKDCGICASSKNCGWCQVSKTCTSGTQEGNCTGEICLQNWIFESQACGDVRITGHLYTSDPTATKLINPELTREKIKVNMRYTKYINNPQKVQIGYEKSSKITQKDGNIVKLDTQKPIFGQQDQLVQVQKEITPYIFDSYSGNRLDNDYQEKVMHGIETT